MTYKVQEGESNALSTGKSSNSSSSSNAAAGLMSFVESVLLSEVVALVVCGVEPDAGAPDIAESRERLHREGIRVSVKVKVGWVSRESWGIFKVGAYSQE